MKVSVSLPDEDVEFLDAYAQAQGLPSRSAVLHKAVRLLRGAELAPAYEDAFASWEESEDAAAWDITTSDNLWPMIRGETRLVNLDPVIGAEANKRRPAVLVSNDGANATAARLGRGVVTVVPVTSNVARVYPFQVKLSAKATGLHTDSKAQAEQVRSVAIQRIGPRIGRVPADVMEQIDEALRLHLAL
jgi:mRNA interferase MazF